MKWHFTNDAPIYSQLMEQIKVGIITGQFRSGTKLPSVRDIALEAGVNPNTMQRAMAELEREGLVYSQRTSGRYVTDDKAVIDKLKHSLARGHVEGFLNSMKSLGFSQDEIVALLKQEAESEVNK